MPGTLANFDLTKWLQQKKKWTGHSNLATGPSLALETE